MKVFIICLIFLFSCSHTKTDNSLDLYVEKYAQLYSNSQNPVLEKKFYDVSHFFDVPSWANGDLENQMFSVGNDFFDLNTSQEDKLKLQRAYAKYHKEIEDFNQKHEIELTVSSSTKKFLQFKSNRLVFLEEVLVYFQFMRVSLFNIMSQYYKGNEVDMLIENHLKVVDRISTNKSSLLQLLINVSIYRDTFIFLSNTKNHKKWSRDFSFLLDRLEDSMEIEYRGAIESLEGFSSQEILKETMFKPKDKIKITENYFFNKMETKKILDEKYENIMNLVRKVKAREKFNEKLVLERGTRIGSVPELDIIIEKARKLQNSQERLEYLNKYKDQNLVGYLFSKFFASKQLVTMTSEFDFNYNILAKIKK